MLGHLGTDSLSRGGGRVQACFECAFYPAARIRDAVAGWIAPFVRRLIQDIEELILAGLDVGLLSGGGQSKGAEEVRLRFPIDVYDFVVHRFQLSCKRWVIALMVRRKVSKRSS